MGCKSTKQEIQFFIPNKFKKRIKKDLPDKSIKFISKYKSIDIDIPLIISYVYIDSLIDSKIYPSTIIILAAHLEDGEDKRNKLVSCGIRSNIKISSYDKLLS